MADDKALEECKVAYAAVMESNAKQNKRWRLIAWISGTAGLSVGAVVGAWAARRGDDKAQGTG